MSAVLSELVFRMPNVEINVKNECYRPKEWPPNPDWVVSLDASGNPLSRWKNSEWDFSPWVGKTYKLDFAGGKSQIDAPALGLQNQNILRLLTTWLLWGLRGPQSWTTLRDSFRKIRRIIAFCESEGIVASELERYPHVFIRIPALFKNAERDSVLLLLDRLQRHRKEISTCLLGEIKLKELAKLFKDSGPSAEIEQTAYISPRIWRYQNGRLRECLVDFYENKEKVEQCYHFCVGAYVKNVGSLEKALTSTDFPATYLPFTKQRPSTNGARKGREYHGPFINTAQRFGIDALLQRWITLKSKDLYDIRHFGAYLNLIQLVAIAYIANFTLQRKEEAGGLRTDCLIWENNVSVGRFAVICGETTKTDKDSDARWPTSPNVEIAVHAASTVAKMRMLYTAQVDIFQCSDEDKKNPYLYHYTYDPWSAVRGGIKPYHIRPDMPSAQNLIKRYPKIFDVGTMKITEDDLNYARKFTPNLDKDGKFQVGKQWPLAFHQLRRTGAINMFASGLLSDSSIQVIMKHTNPFQTQYYGRNYTRMNFNEDVKRIIDEARYEITGKQIGDLVSERYVSPAGNERKNEILVNMLSSKDFDTLVKAGKKGEVFFRETRLGGCVKRGSCEYGGIESVARCAGGDGNKPCHDAIFDKTKKKSVQRILEITQERAKLATSNSPRKGALNAEVKGMRNYLNVISK